MSGKILMVDDDDNLALQIVSFLELQGYEMSRARDGQEGLTKLTQVQPDLVLLDMNMPQLGGIGFLKQMRALKLQHPPALVVFTARPNMGDFFDGLEVGAYLTKPCEPEVLLETIMGLLARRAATPQPAEARSAGRKRALIAENDLTVAARLKGHFQAAGWEVEHVVSGPAALEKAIVSRPDVLVTELILPGMNGDRLAAALSELPNTKGIPVVLYDDSGRREPASKYVTGKTDIKALVAGNAVADILTAAEQAVSRGKT